MTYVLILVSILTVFLAVYSIAHYLCTAIVLFTRQPKRTDFGHPQDSVAVLIPARNEGGCAHRAISSLLAQDHAGAIDIYLLVKDKEDTAIAVFKESFPEVDFSQPVGSICQMVKTKNRTASVVYVGVDPKSTKVNWMASRLKTPYSAILDCDHQAHPDWIRTSLCLMSEKKARIVQGRRQPISAHGFFQLWDSLQQHIGCELFNAAFTRMGLSVFFTGTTVVMDTDLLQSRPLSACITEDTDFSYGIFLEGVVMINNPYSGSDEETSPDVYSFLARRRRWANGHTEAFVRHLPKLFTAPISFASRLQFFFHGAHYLIALVVFALHLAISLVFLAELSAVSVVSSTLLSLILSGWLASTQGTIGRTAKLFEVTVLFGWIFPAVVILMNMTQAVLMNDFTRAVLPIHPVLQVMGLVGFCAPLAVLVGGLARFRQLGVGSLIAVVSSYIFAFYLDISGVLLGMADYAFGSARWRPVNRGDFDLLEVVADPRELLPAYGIKDSWRLRPVLSSARRVLPRVYGK